MCNNPGMMTGGNMGYGASRSQGGMRGGNMGYGPAGMPRLSRTHPVRNPEPMTPDRPHTPKLGRGLTPAAPTAPKPQPAGMPAFQRAMGQQMPGYGYYGSGLMRNLGQFYRMLMQAYRPQQAGGVGPAYGQGPEKQFFPKTSIKDYGYKATPKPAAETEAPGGGTWVRGQYVKRGSRREEMLRTGGR